MIAIEQVVRLKYPSADLSQYFYFLRQASGKDHKHHIAPRAEFPELVAVKENSITLSFQEHFYAHYLLALAVPECRAFQIAFYMMANFYAASVKVSDLPLYAEVYERGCTAQLESIMRLQVDPTFKASRDAAASETFKKLNADPVFRKAYDARNSARLTKLNSGPEGRAHQVVAARSALHTRWHVNRGVISDTCELCQK